MKQRILSVILGLVFLVTFNALFFLLAGTDVCTAIWISYGFIHLAYIFVLVTPLLTVKTDTAPMLNYTIWSQTITYFIVELILGTGFVVFDINAPSDSIMWPLLVQGIVFAIFLFILITNMMANEVTQKHEEQRIEQSYQFDSAVDDLLSLSHEDFSPEVKKAIDKCYNELRYGPLRSHPSISGIENDIRDKIVQLQDSILENDPESQTALARELYRRIQERNRKLKYIH